MDEYEAAAHLAILQRELADIASYIRERGLGDEILQPLNEAIHRIGERFEQTDPKGAPSMVEALRVIQGGKT